MTWQKVSLLKLGVLLAHKNERLRWRWRTLQKSGRKSLQLVSPRGIVWDFKLNQGAWIRKVEPNQPKQQSGHQP